HAAARRLSRRTRFGRRHVRLRKLDVPVAEVVPEKMVDGLHGLVEVVALDCVADCTRRAVEARDYPAVVQRPTFALAFKPAAHLRALRVEEAEARSVPDFVGEVSVRLDLVVVPA